MFLFLFQRLKAALQGRGYGIHSPSLYHLLREVVRQREAYYCYRPLGEKHEAARQAIRMMNEKTKAAERKMGLLPQRECEFLFRLANELQPTHAYLWGCGTGLEREYLQAANSRLVCEDWAAVQHKEWTKMRTNEQAEREVERVEERAKQTEARLFVLNCERGQAVPFQALEAVLNGLSERDAVFISGFRRSFWSCGGFSLSRKGELPGKDWKALRSHSRVRVSINLHTCGILLGLPGDYHKRHIWANL